MKAIEIQAKVVIVPNPWEIIKERGTMIGKGLIVLRLIFRICAKSKRLINKKTCLVSIVWSSFLETYTRTPQQIRISKKFIITVLKKIKFCVGLVTSSYEEIIEIIIQITKIRKTSIFLM